MRFNFLSAICLVGCTISVSADLSVLQKTVQDEAFAHRDLENAFRNLESRPYDPYTAADQVIYYHRRLVDVVRRGAGNIRRGPSITAIESMSISGITDGVIGMLQGNMNAFIADKTFFASARKMDEVYRTLQDSVEAHTEYSDALTSRLPRYEAGMPKISSQRWITMIQSAVFAYKPY
jgi:hypothetical protein